LGFWTRISLWCQGASHPVIATSCSRIFLGVEPISIILEALPQRFFVVDSLLLFRGNSRFPLSLILG
jgi:hypothetical protein